MTAEIEIINEYEAGDNLFRIQMRVGNVVPEPKEAFARFENEAVEAVRLYWQERNVRRPVRLQKAIKVADFDEAWQIWQKMKQGKFSFSAR